MFLKPCQITDQNQLRSSFSVWQVCHIQHCRVTGIRHDKDETNSGSEIESEEGSVVT